MKKISNFLKNDKFIIRIFIISFLLMIITLIYILLNYSKLPPLLPIFNQLPWGEQRLSTTLGIFIPSLVTLIIFIFNFFASSFSYKDSPLLARMLAITTFITSLLGLLFIFRTIALII